MIFLVDGVAHNHMNFGNFLFGAACADLGLSLPELLLGDTLLGKALNMAMPISIKKWSIQVKLKSALYCPYLFFKMNWLKQFLILISFSIFVSCNNMRYKKFTDKHLHEDFSAFADKCVFVRGRDQDHSLILFIDADLSVNKNNGPFIVYVNEKSKKVVKTSSHLMTDTSNIDKPQLKELAIRFLYYNVESLKVDTSGNVFIGLKNREKPDLIRFSNESYKTLYYKDGWSKINENWYTNID